MDRSTIDLVERAYAVVEESRTLVKELEVVIGDAQLARGSTQPTMKPGGKIPLGRDRSQVEVPKERLKAKS